MNNTQGNVPGNEIFDSFSAVLNSFSLDDLEPLVEFAKQHAAPILIVISYFLGWTIGRCFKSNKMSTVLQSYQKFTDQEQHILETQNSFLGRFSTVRRLLFLAMFMLVLFMAIVSLNEQNGSFFARYVASNTYPLAVTSVLVLLVVLSGKYRDWRLNRIKKTLVNAKSQKSKYLEDFLELIGYDMRNDIIEHESERLASKMKEEKQREAERNETAQKLQEVIQERSALESSLTELRKASSAVPKISAAYEEFHARLAKFNWCAQCYNPEAIRKFALEIEQKKKAEEEKLSKQKKRSSKVKEDGKLTEQSPRSPEPAKEPAKLPEPQTAPVTPDTHSDCKESCLVRYHIFCDALETELNDRLDKVKRNL